MSLVVVTASTIVTHLHISGFIVKVGMLSVLVGVVGMILVANTQLPLSTASTRG